jgi:hypothetical protein
MLIAAKIVAMTMIKMVDSIPNNPIREERDLQRAITTLVSLFCLKVLRLTGWTATTRPENWGRVGAAG